MRKFSSASSWLVDRVRCAYVGSGADHICGPGPHYNLCSAKPDGDLSADDLRCSGSARDHNRDPVDQIKIHSAPR
jgi:hypothetical protein